LAQERRRWTIPNPALAWSGMVPPHRGVCRGLCAALLVLGLSSASGLTLASPEHWTAAASKNIANTVQPSKCEMPRPECFQTQQHAPVAGQPLVAASVAVHPPKFAYVGRFLEEYAGCKAAMESMSVHIVFSNDDDLHMFRSGLKLLHPTVPESAWTPVVANVTLEFLESIGVHTKGEHKQFLAAWKKWYGIAHLMDLGAAAPVYGLMLDSELLLFDRTDCGPNSAWYTLYERIRRSEATKTFQASQTSETLVRYDFGKGNVVNGCAYDRGIIQQNVHWLTAGGTACQVETCKEYGCEQVQRQVDNCLWSWWTDIPYMNLTIASRLLGWVTSPTWEKWHRRTSGGTKPEQDSCSVQGPDRWKRLLRRVSFSRFEYVSYQQWCVLQEGFSFRDVTNITGPAKWGSYLEDPVKGSNVTELRPLWASAEAVVLSRQGQIQSLSAAEPPLIIFHVDHRGSHFSTKKWMQLWNPVIAAAA